MLDLEFGICPPRTPIESQYIKMSTNFNSLNSQVHRLRPELGPSKKFKYLNLVVNLFSKQISKSCNNSCPFELVAWRFDPIFDFFI